MGLISRVSSRTYRHESKVAKEANAQIEAKATKDASTIQVIYWSRFQCIINNSRFSLHTHSKTTPSVSDKKEATSRRNLNLLVNFNFFFVLSCSIDIFRKFDLIS